MIVDEQARNDLYVGLQETLGPDRATTLMAYLSPFPWSDLATKQDLVALRADFGVLRGDFEILRADFGGLQDQFGGLRVAVKQDVKEAMEHQGRVLGYEMRQYASDQRDLMRKEMITQTWVIVFAVIGAMISLAGVFIATQ